MTKSTKARKAKPNWYPPWAPRFWSGMRMGDYWRLLRENRFQIHPSRYAMTCLIGGCSVVNSTLGMIQNLTHGRRIERTELAGPPVFIVGHWRSGTTLMHELVALDQRFQFPSNFDAFIPNHFLVSRYLFYPIVSLLMPPRRPMDNMSMGAGSPQEDDFALVSYGAPTPYRRIAFPNRQSRDHLDLNFANSTPATQTALRTAMERFLKSLTLRYQSQLILKSPPHTGRIRQLLEWFPDAKFIHLSRHPYKLVPSTMRLWRLLDELQGHQVPSYDDTWLKNYIFECKDLMYAAYFEQRDEFADNQLIEVRFEDLVANPVQEMSRVYGQLELGDFDQVQPSIDNYFSKKKNHKKNELNLDLSLQTDIDSNWQPYMQAFGYESAGPAPTPNPTALTKIIDTSETTDANPAGVFIPDPAGVDAND
ncbi:MAG: sulfotransferase [Planctomycetota bacterium]